MGARLDFLGGAPRRGARLDWLGDPIITFETNLRYETTFAVASPCSGITPSTISNLIASLSFAGWSSIVVTEQPETANTCLVIASGIWTGAPVPFDLGVATPPGTEIRKVVRVSDGVVLFEKQVVVSQPCPVDKVPHPPTGQCLDPCPPGQIFDPQGNCVEPIVTPVGSCPFAGQEKVAGKCQCPAGTSLKTTEFTGTKQRCVADCGPDEVPAPSANFLKCVPRTCPGGRAPDDSCLPTSTGPPGQQVTSTSGGAGTGIVIAALVAAGLLWAAS